MTAKHSPGPWSAEGQEDGCSVGWVIMDQTGERIASTYDPGDTDAETQNAALIASAPEMLEALSNVAVLGHGKCTIGRPLADMIRAAITKATGEAV